jgi:DNA transformation protein and related proteins
MRRAKSKSKNPSNPRAGLKRGKRQRNANAKPLLGLGPVSLKVLRAAGIARRADLEKLGPVRAFLAAKRIEPRVTLNLLWGIAGAVTNTHWTRLPPEYRSSLLLDYDASLDAERSLAATSNNSPERKRAR